MAECMRVLREKVEYRMNLQAALDNFLQYKMSLSEAAANYHVSFDDIYNKTGIKEYKILPDFNSRYEAAIEYILDKLGCRAITITLTGGIMMQTLKKTAYKFGLGLPYLWIEYNYERICIEIAIIPSDMLSSFMERLKTRSRLCMYVSYSIEMLQTEVYQFLKEKGMLCPQEWEINERAGILWAKNFEAMFIGFDPVYIKSVDATEFQEERIRSEENTMGNLNVGRMQETVLNDPAPSGAQIISDFIPASTSLQTESISTRTLDDTSTVEIVPYQPNPLDVQQTLNCDLESVNSQVEDVFTGIVNNAISVNSQIEDVTIGTVDNTISVSSRINITTGTGNNTISIVTNMKL